MDRLALRAMMSGDLRRDAPGSTDEYFELLRPVARGIAATFGRHCEVVLHDYRDPEHSVVAVEGDVTQRRVGSPISQIGLSMIAQGDDAEDQINYITRAPNGRVLKSSTVLLRDADGHVFGALCINFDVTDLRLLVGSVAELAGSPLTPATPITFTDDAAAVIRSVIDEEEVKLGRPIDRMSRQDRLVITQALDHRGVFALQRSVAVVAEHLGVSRASVYSYIEDVRSGAAARPSRDGGISAADGRGAGVAEPVRSGDSG